MMNSKDLLAIILPMGERRTTFSGFVGRSKTGEGYLLISQELLAKSRKTTAEGLLNLKDLLTVFLSSCGATRS